MSKVEYSQIALEDLKNIRDYISINWGDDAAAKALKKIISDIKKLKLYPGAGADLGKIIGVPTVYRYLYSEKNYIFYYMEFDKVRIIRVLHERQNYMQQLFEINPESDGDE